MPDKLRIMVRAATPDERGFSYTQPELFKDSGCIGHLRADMGHTGTQFFSSWDDHQPKLKTQAFKDEFDQFIHELQKNPEYNGILTSRAALYAYCNAHPEAALDNGQEFVFRADTDKNSYMLRLNPNRERITPTYMPMRKSSSTGIWPDSPSSRRSPFPPKRRTRRKRATGSA